MRTQPSDIEVALERFALREYLMRNGFEMQGRSKREAVNDCPYCFGEDKLSVNVETRIARCFVCQRRIKVLDVVAKIEGSYQQAVSVILSETGVFHSLDFIPELTLKTHGDFFRDPLWEPMPIQPPLSFRPLTGHHPYTLKRGFDLAALRLMGVGLCDSGRYADRLVFPVRRLDGAWLYFQSRATWEKSEVIPGLDGKVHYRKNMNPEHVGPEYADASDVLLGLDIVIRGGFKRVAAVEGPTDLLNSLPAAVATMGKTFSDRQIQLLLRAGVKEVDLAYDPDAYELPVNKITGKPTGRRPPALIAAERLDAAGLIVRLVRYEGDSDPGNTSPIQNWQLRMEASRYGDGSRLLFV